MCPTCRTSRISTPRFRGDAGTKTNEGDIRSGFYAAYDAPGCEFIPLFDPEIDRRLKAGPDLVSASFVIPYPPGFPIMVPGQVITQETIDFMRKLDVKEIHGYDAKEGLKLVRAEALGEDRRAPKPGAAPKLKAAIIKGGLNMQGFFTVSAAESVSAAVLRRRARGLDRTREHQGLRPRHGRRRHRGRRGLSVWASFYGVKLELNNFAKSLFYYLFMYGVGLRVGPSFINSLKGDGLKFTFLARGVERARARACRDRRQAVRAAARRRRRHARGLADHVGGDRLGRAGDHLGCRQAAGRHEAGGCHRA